MQASSSRWRMWSIALLFLLFPAVNSVRDSNTTALIPFKAGMILPSTVTEGSPIAAPERTFQFSFGTITLQQQWEKSNHGATIWDAGVMLAHYIDEHGKKRYGSLSGRSAVELGAGQSLPSFVCARLGASGGVIATDGDEEVLPLLRENIASVSAADGNSECSGEACASMDVFRLRWGNKDDALALPLKSAPPRLVLAADVVYPSNAAVWPLLLASMRQLCELSPTDGTSSGGSECTVLLAHTPRGNEEASFLDVVAEAGFVAKLIPVRRLYEPMRHSGTRIYEFMLKTVIPEDSGVNAHVVSEL